MLSLFLFVQIAVSAFVYKSLNADPWPKFLELLTVRKHLSVDGGSYDLFKNFGVDVCNQIADKHSHIVFEGLFLVVRHVAGVQVNCHTDKQRIKQIVLLNCRLLALVLLRSFFFLLVKMLVHELFYCIVV
jgi:hypothetical protein